MSNEKPTHFELVKSVKELKEKVETLEKKLSVVDPLGIVPGTSLTQTIVPNTATITGTFPIESVVSSATQYPIPLEYRQLVDNILNKSFGIRIVPRSDAPLFEFIIVVPEKYSSLTPNQKELMNEDLRIKVLSYADGVNGVRLWCETVYNNFGQEMKTQITQDRV